jgi:demethoxyubiquinone hydroxylase (CLK1/Coq7/Cat5 family)
MASSGMLHRVALVRTDVSEELSASIIRVTRIGELGATLAVTSNRSKLRSNTMYFWYYSVYSQLASVACYG